MSRAFLTASNEYLLLNDALGVTDWPFTMACWFNADDVTTGNCLVSIGDANTPSGQTTGLEARGDAGDIIRARVDASKYAISSTTYSANTWHHACGVFTSDTSRAVYLDGGGKGTDATSRTFVPDASRWGIGAFVDDTESNYTNGSIAEVGIWNVSLTDAEAAILAAGYSPLFVRPESLIAYAPLIGKTSPEVDLVNGTGWTLNATPTADAHPPIIMPTSPIFPPPTAGAAPAVTPRPNAQLILTRPPYLQPHILQ